MELYIAHVLIRHFSEEIFHFFVVIESNFDLSCKNRESYNININVRFIIEFHMIDRLLLLIYILIEVLVEIDIMMVFSYELACHYINSFSITNYVNLNTFLILYFLFTDEDSLNIIPNMNTLVIMFLLGRLLFVSLVGEYFQTIAFSSSCFRSQSYSDLREFTSIFQI